MTDDELRELATLMVWGVSDGFECDGKAYKPFEPLPSWHAASFMGIRRHRARIAVTDPRFRRIFAENLDALRNGERARNLHVAAGIRDEEIEGESAADRQAKLKAIQVIEGPQGASVNVNISSTTNSVSITPGYVIRLPAAAGAPAMPVQADEPLLIEGQAVEEDAT